MALTSCDNFLDIKVHNPCPFQVEVAFAGAHAPAPTTTTWPHAESVAPSSVKSITLNAPAGPFPYPTRIQVRAAGRPPITDVVAATHDGFDWSIPNSFCG
jgi:hypothetical protein